MEVFSRLRKRRLVAGIISIMLLSSSALALAQTEVEPGFNLFSRDQEVELGRESAREVEKELPVVEDESVQRYVQRVQERLAREAPGAEYPYQVKVLNLAEPNAFALPGGFLYVNRGLVEAVEDEGELAGVLAHEIAHVALRHGTNQASKAFLAQAGLSLLGGLLGDSTVGDVAEAVGGVGVPLLFLKFSRSAEEEADTVAAQIMARAGYRPLELAEFFETLQSQSRGRPAEFLSSHPSYANRRENIQREANLLDAAERADVGGLGDVQAELDRMAPAPSMEQFVERGAALGSSFLARQAAGEPSMEAPSAESDEFRQADGYYRFSYPSNWEIHQPERGFGVTLAPEGGIVTSGGRTEIIYGAIVSHYEAFHNEEDAASLEPLELPDVSESLKSATEDILLQILETNSYLEPVAGSAERLTVDGKTALSVELSGSSPTTGETERVTVVARDASDGHVLYVLVVAPSGRAAELDAVLDRMLSSLRVDEGALHQQSGEPDSR